jgi:uncharacterized protein (TIGR04222 family)
VQYAGFAPAHPLSRTVYRGGVTDSPLTAGEVRAAAETHSELGPEYRDAVLESFVDRVGREIDARVDARLAQAAAQPLAAQRLAAPPAPRQPRQASAMVLAIVSITLGIPLTAIVVAAGDHPVGFWGLLVVWVAIAAINLGYAWQKRQPGDHHH